MTLLYFGEAAVAATAVAASVKGLLVVILAAILRT